MLFATAFNKLSVAVQKLDHNFTIKTDAERVKLLVNDNTKIRKYLRAAFIDLDTNEEVFLNLDDDLTEFSLEWEFFLDRKSQYSLNFKMYDEDGKYNKRTNINIKNLSDFKEHSVTTSDNVKVQVSKNSNGDIRFISS